VRSPRADPARTAKVAGVLKDLTSLLSEGHERVGLVTTPSDATVYVDVVSPGTKYKAPLLWYFEPGKHRFIVLRSGFRTEERSFVVALGETVTLEVPLQPDLPAPGPLPPDGQGGEPPPPLPVGPPDGGASGSPDEPAGIGAEPGKGSSRTWAWVTLGLGVALLGTGGVLEYVALDRAGGIDRSAQAKIDSGELTYEAGMLWRDGQYDDRVEPPNVAAIACMATGGASLVAGAIWLVVTRGEESPESTILPVVSPDGASGMMFRMSF